MRQAAKFFLRITFLSPCFLCASAVYADHLKGGWIKYTYVSSTSTDITYQVSLYQYSDCSEPEKVDKSVFLGIFDAGTSAVLNPVEIQLTKSHLEVKDNFGPCFQNPPRICYIIAEYTSNITVPKNSGGYILSFQRCCRIAGIVNVPYSNAVGLTYTLTIPGGANSTDNSPEFDFKDTAAICLNSRFSIDLGATDKDGDSLSYSLCSGLTGASPTLPIAVQPTLPPYTTIPYNMPYEGVQPLGINASINSATGIFSGTAPDQLGTYVVAVCINEYRHGVYIGHTRKEIHLDVENCRLGGAVLKPSYTSCDGYDFAFADEATGNYKYSWDFGVTSITTDTSTQATPVYTYKDTGDYVVKLRVSNDLGCSDSTTTHVKIYPGFTTDFSVDGSCLKNPYSFTDLTATKYGYVDSWQWLNNYDETISSAQNFDYAFPDTGYKTITLISTNSKGCVDTAKKTILVTEGPDLQLKFADTIICNIDTLQLQSSSSLAGAKFTWSPLYNINDTSSRTPLVFPKQTTTYNVAVTYKGCSTFDSVTVNVVDHVEISMPADTLICLTDSILLTPSTNALNFAWLPSASLNNSSLKNPVAVPTANTTYYVHGSIGKCSADAKQTINVAPYPAIDAGNNVSICYGRTTQLKASTNGQTFSWSPANSLIDSNTLTPIAGPQETTAYILTAQNSVGCPKPVSDTITVNVIPKVNAFAGNDTIAVAKQPIQLNATGGEYYEWSPSTYLSNPLIPNPVAIFPGREDTILYTVRVSTEQGCFSTDSIRVLVFETRPTIFVPTAFTPNGDGRNDLMKPTLAGMQKFLYFTIYNRWGQLLYSTSQQGKGWDGNYEGNKEPSGTYVFVAAAIDFTGKNYFIKGTFVLIR